MAVLVVVVVVAELIPVVVAVELADHGQTDPRMMFRSYSCSDMLDHKVGRILDEFPPYGLFTKHCAGIAL